MSRMEDFAELEAERLAEHQRHRTALRELDRRERALLERLRDAQVDMLRVAYAVARRMNSGSPVDCETVKRIRARLYKRVQKHRLRWNQVPRK